jgi:hypothetical protein
LLFKALIESTVTFHLNVVPSTAQTFQFTTDAGNPLSFTLTDGSSQVYANVVDGRYRVTLSADQSAGYDVGVSCAGADTVLVSSVHTTFNVIGSDVTCTFTLTSRLC